MCIPVGRDKEQASRDFSRVNPLDVALSQAKQQKFIISEGEETALI